MCLWFLLNSLFILASFDSLALCYQFLTFFQAAFQAVETFPEQLPNVIIYIKFNVWGLSYQIIHTSTINQAVFVIIRSLQK